MRISNRLSTSLFKSKVKSVEQLSSGKRVDAASEDMGALSLATKLEVKDISLRMALRNINDAISMVTTTDKGIENLQHSLNRIRELSIQSANGSHNDNDRALIQKECSEQLLQMEAVTKTTSFNDISLLNNEGGASANWSPVFQHDLSSQPPGAYRRNGALNGQAPTSIGGRLAWQQTSDWNQLWIPMPSFTKPCVKISVDMYLPSNRSASGVIDAFARHVGYNGTANAVSAGFGNRPQDFMVARESGNTFANINTPVQEDTWVTISIEADTVTGAAKFSIGGTIISEGTVNLANLANDKIKLQSNAGSWQPSGVAWSNLEVSESDALGGTGLKVQAGSETADHLDTTLTTDVSLSALDLTTIDISTIAGAKSALDSVDSALDKLSASRAKIGASMNTLLSQLDLVQQEATSTSLATSKIIDLDYAKASSEFAEQTTRMEFNLKARQLAHHLSRERLAGLLNF